MKVFIAEDDSVFRRLLESTLKQWDYEVEVAANGMEAWEALKRETHPCIAILARKMPLMDGLELCRRVRATPERQFDYIILTSARDEQDDLAAGLQAGANDFLTKPFDLVELRTRLAVGERFIEPQRNRVDGSQELGNAASQVRQLQGIIPICCYCNSVRIDEHSWEQVEVCAAKDASADFSHGICPHCWESVVRPQMEELWGESPPYEG